MKNDIISSFVYPVAAYSDDDFLYIATGFLYRKKTKFYFITSLSSILGRQVPNGEFKLKNKKIPNVLKTSFSIFEDDLIKIKKRVFPITIPVYNKNFEPNFFGIEKMLLEKKPCSIENFERKISRKSKGK